MPSDAIAAIDYCEYGTLLTLDTAKAHDIARQFGRCGDKLKLSILIWDGFCGNEPCSMSLVVEGARRIWGDGVYDLTLSDSERCTASLMREILE